MINPKNDPSVHNGFWTDTANLMQRYQDLVDARILYTRYPEKKYTTDELQEAFEAGRKKNLSFGEFLFTKDLQIKK